MADGITIKITDNSNHYLDELEKAVKRALLTCGLEARGNATDIITANGSVDTGLLRASIAFALGGETATPQTYRADVYGDGNGNYSGRFLKLNNFLQGPQTERAKAKASNMFKNYSVLQGSQTW